MNQTLDLQKLDLRKNQVLDLKKSAGIPNLTSQVALCLDYSGSMDTLYTSGKVQEALERLLPLGLAFDDNEQVDFYLFHNDVWKMSDNLTIENTGGYVRNKILGRYEMGGTAYAPAINKIVKDYGGHLAGHGQLSEKKGLLGKLFGGGSKGEPVSTPDSKPFTNPAYVMFITDGENSDHSEAEAAVINAAKYGIFWQFIGIGSSSFSFLKRLDNLSGRLIDNANFFQLPDLHSTSDEDLYKLLLAEFPSWIPQAKAKGLIL